MTIEDKIPDEFKQHYQRGFQKEKLKCNTCKYNHIINKDEGFYEYCSVRDKILIDKLGCEDYEE